MLGTEMMENKDISEEVEQSKAKAINSINDWLKNLEDNLIPIILESTDAHTRIALVEALKTNEALSVKQCVSVIHGLNYHVFQLIGAVRPDATLCRCLARILREKLPECFGVGSLFARQSNNADLARNIVNNFYNRYVRGKTELGKKSKIDKEVFRELEISKRSAKELPEDYNTMPTQLKDWIKHFDQHFIAILLDNMQATTRVETGISIRKHEKLSPKNNSAVINSINFHAFKFIGAVRPDASLCRVLASLLRKKLPETFDDNGSKKERKRGEGGKGLDLPRRIGTAFYNSHLRLSRK